MRTSNGMLLARAISHAHRILSVFVFVGFGLVLCATSAKAGDNPLDDMVGCWVSDDYAPSTLLKNAGDPDSATVTHDRMWLKLDRIEGTEHLVLGHIYEWDEANTYVLGPIYENGGYDPVRGFLIMGFPAGGLDAVHQEAKDALLYVHNKAAVLSAFSVRPLSRIDCTEAAGLEQDLLAKQQSLN